MKLYVILISLALAYRASRSPILQIALDFSNSNKDLEQIDGALGVIMQIMAFLSLQKDYSSNEKNDLDKIRNQRQDLVGYSKFYRNYLAPSYLQDCWNEVTCVLRNVSIPSVNGLPRQVPVMLVQPNTKPVGLRRPVVYYHSGGGVVGDAYNTPMPYGIAMSLDAIVISVNYRLAPENPYPAGVDDGFEALNWCIENCGHLGADLSLLTLAGESGGGLITAAIAQRWKDLKRPEKIHQLIMIIPMLSPVLTRSYVKYEHIHSLSMRQMGSFWDLYAPNLHDCVVDPICSPASATVTRLEGIAERVLVAPGRADVLHSEAIEYARKLKQAGVNTTVHEFRNTHMGAIIFGTLLSKGKLNELLN